MIQSNRTGRAPKFALAALFSILVGAAGGAAAADFARPIAFDIPAQPLATALLAFSEQAGVQVLVESQLVEPFSAPAIQRSDTPARVLETLLRTSGLTFSFVNPDAVAIRADKGFMPASTGAVIAPDRGAVARDSSGRPILMAAARAQEERGAGADAAEPQNSTADSRRAGSLDEVIVSARKREESLVDVPVSVQAFTAADIAERGFLTLQDLITFTPGMNFQNMGNSQPGRYNTGIRFRGLEGAASSPSNQTGALFVDGVFILGGAGSVPLNDVARVEIIKGPQAAYFGRGTFGGAINYVSIDPGREFTGRLSAQHSPNHGSNAFSASLDGPILDTLSGRVTVASTSKGAMFTATDGGKLGAERTDSLTATLLFKPTEDLRIKVRAQYGEDEDGPAATTFVPYRFVGNCPIGTPVTVETRNGSFATTLRQRYHCGAVPNYPVSNNTTFYTVSTPMGLVNTRDIVIGTALGLPDPGTPKLDGYGLKTFFQVHSLSADYAINDAWDIGLTVGYNNRSTSQVRDADAYDSPGWVSRGFLELTARSAELRINYGADRWRALLGVNLYEQDQSGDIDGGFGVFSNLFGSADIGPGATVDSNEIKTVGVFGAVEYDLFDRVTLSVEARQQRDEVVGIGGRYPGPFAPAPKEVYDDFLPRFLATFRPREGMSLYASYAEGNQPGIVNNVIATLTPAELAAAQALLPGLAASVDAEKLESFEIGWKQQFADGASWLAISAYDMDWSNAKGFAQLTFVSPTDGRVISTSAFIPGQVKVRGVEAEGHWSPIDGLDLHATLGIIDSEYADYPSAGVNSLFGVTAGNSYQAAGNKLPRSPRESGSLSISWRDDISSTWSWYVRGDASYFGKVYTDETNLAWIDAYSLLNTRVGLVKSKDFTLELFCTNCSNERGWRTGRRLIDFGDTAPAPNFFTNQGAIVQPLDAREVGLRIQLDF